MAPPRLTRERAAEYVAAYRAAGTQDGAAEMLGVTQSSVCQGLIRAAQYGLLEPPKAQPGYVITKRSQTYDEAGSLVRQSITSKPEPGEAFEPLPGHVIKGESVLLDAEGRTVQKWVKTREGPSSDDIITALRDALSEFKGLALIKPPPPASNADLMTQYSIPDAHFGMLSWGKETGQPYDLAIAKRTIEGAIDNLVSQSLPSETALILWMGDTTHQNDRTNMTPRSGHTLDVDGRFQKVLRTTADVAIRVTERALEKHQRVIVRFLPGNHDPEVALALTLALSLYYAGHDRVTVDETPGGHFYYRFGKVLIGATHGHTMKPDRMAMMLACDRPEDWGQTKFRHFFFGHIHKETGQTIGDVRVESFSSPAARDAYAHDGGWRSGRALVAITYHQTEGEKGRHRVNL